MPRHAATKAAENVSGHLGRLLRVGEADISAILEFPDNASTAAMAIARKRILRRPMSGSPALPFGAGWAWVGCG